MPSIESLLHRRNDLSTFLVHLTRGTGDGSAADDDAAKANLMSILRGQKLEARTVYGMARDLAVKYSEIAKTQRTVCFTETPLEHVWMMCEDIERRDMKFKGYGVAFTKTFARRRGVNPVWYLDISPGHDFLTNPVNRMVAEAAKIAEGGDIFAEWDAVDADILRLTPFMETMGKMNNGGRKEFWWEREWRHIGDFTFFAKDIVAVFGPEDWHSEARRFMTDDLEYGRVPPVIDPRWGLERVIAALAGVADPGPFPN
ncbi:abortive infection system antitoxin AbiGi family protein [Kitasatospora purpeofusca]|uniref:abortive infection system antitoxin AbiGi family protein n=1 Tax=Kitasatospora purpeofusca TaxID=67352 RepID=UPI0036822286